MQDIRRKARNLNCVYYMYLKVYQTQKVNVYMFGYVEIYNHVYFITANEEKNYIGNNFYLGAKVG